MSDTHPSAASVVYGAFAGHRGHAASPTDAAALDGAASIETVAAPPVPGMPPPAPLQPPAQDLLDAGRVRLDRMRLRRLRHARMLSQQDMADDCWRRNFRISIATIKRVESGRAVRFRIARELARYFDVPVNESPSA